MNPEGKKTEGAFYLWSADEVAEALGGGARAKLFAARYGVRPEGNCTLSPRRCGRNVLAARLHSSHFMMSFPWFCSMVARFSHKCTRTFLRTCRHPAALLCAPEKSMIW